MKHEFAHPNHTGGYDLSPAAVLIVAGDTVFGEPAETTPDGQRCAQRYIDEFLAAALAGGFRQSDILRTRLARREKGPQLVKLAMEAEKSAGPGRLKKVLANLNP